MRVLEEVSAHEPATGGEICGIGLPAAKGSVRFRVIGPEGGTPTWPEVGELDEIASVWALAPVVEVVPEVPPEEDTAPGE